MLFHVTNFCAYNDKHTYTYTGLERKQISKQQITKKLSGLEIHELIIKTTTI